MAGLRVTKSFNVEAMRSGISSESTGYYGRLVEHTDIYRRDVDLIRHALGDGRHIDVLDLGFGKGGFLELARSHFNVTGVDINLEAVKHAKDRGHTVFLEDVRKTHFKDGLFDAIYSKEVIEHLADPLTMILECKRLLRSNGILFLVCPTNFSLFYPVANFYDDYTHVRPFTRASLTTLLGEAGLDVLMIEGFTSGRNRMERFLGNVVGRVFPYAWRCMGVKR
jgi:2-polyprenyl-3-methyl-5-hydroxy-6-metoxy-1,4-benzoquinol methylase